MVLTEEEQKLFMRSEEIAERLFDGEDPLALSIEAWERKKAAIRVVQDTSDIPMSERDCPLCHLYMDSGCNGCPLEEAGEGCIDDLLSASESPYHVALYAFRLMPTKSMQGEELYELKERAAQHMIDVLKSVQGRRE